MLEKYKALLIHILWTRSYSKLAPPIQMRRWYGRAQNVSLDIILWYIAKTIYLLVIGPIYDIELICIVQPSKIPSLYVVMKIGLSTIRNVSKTNLFSNVVITTFNYDLCPSLVQKLKYCTFFRCISIFPDSKNSA